MLEKEEKRKTINREKLYKLRNCFVPFGRHGQLPLATKSIKCNLPFQLSPSQGLLLPKCIHRISSVFALGLCCSFEIKGSSLPPKFFQTNSETRQKILNIPPPLIPTTLIWSNNSNYSLSYALYMTSATTQVFNTQ